jgi:hypothetical protein
VYAFCPHIDKSNLFPSHFSACTSHTTIELNSQLRTEQTPLPRPLLFLHLSAELLCMAYSLLNIGVHSDTLDKDDAQV